MCGTKSPLGKTLNVPSLTYTLTELSDLEAENDEANLSRRRAGGRGGRSKTDRLNSAAEGANAAGEAVNGVTNVVDGVKGWWDEVHGEPKPE